ncbi:NADPH-dependent FMN reductase [Massilia sp. TS11]|uniref:NADPH-dependent FMN reductase n=1 Tax=Massilia sp. TS11 TaxID=2908003 RepID=UPI001EDB12A6|nr:NADPH-dependent FMN reductase [Massilia sp. TS11]MCG2584261.1 NAD(P)H-dependent oxidoreductase [Massilia sp. TS11]
MNVLALAGSLRALSYNRLALEGAALLAPPGMRVEVYPGIGALPLFNPDLDPATQAPVQRLLAAVEAADALLIASPEYAHGISGVMKNALDWLVAMETFPGKPVLLINTSPRASHAQAALREVLQTMSARLLPECDITLPLQGSRADLAALLATPALRAPLEHGLQALLVQWRSFLEQGLQDE